MMGGVPETASTNWPLMKSLVNLISGTTTPAAAAAPLPLQPSPAIDEAACSRLRVCDSPDVSLCGRPYSASASPSSSCG